MGTHNLSIMITFMERLSAVLNGPAPIIGIPTKMTNITHCLISEKYI